MGNRCSLAMLILSTLLNMLLVCRVVLHHKQTPILALARQVVPALTTDSEAGQILAIADALSTAPAGPHSSTELTVAAYSGVSLLAALWSRWRSASRA